MRYGTLQTPPYRMFAVVCILLNTKAAKLHYSNTSMFYASNKYLHAKNLRMVMRFPEHGKPGDQPEEQQAGGVGGRAEEWPIG